MIRKIKENKKILIIIAIISYIIISNIVIVKYLRNLERCFNTKILYGNENNIFEFIKLVYYNKIIWLICIIIASILSFFVLDVIYVRKRMKIENDGVKLKSKDGTHGTANFMDVREIEELQIGDEENTPGIVLGKTLDTDEIIVLPDTYKDINRNVMIWGASGSGKSTSYIIPNTLKIIDQENKEDRLKELSLKGKNVICTDPKGELYALTSKTFKDNGYDVKVFNLVSPKHSDGIDLIKLIENEKDAQEFAQIVISTSQNAGKSGDEFWQNEQQNLLIALLLHIRFEVEDKNKQNMRYLMSILASGNIKTVDEVFKYSKGITRNSYKVYAQGTDSIKQSTITGLATKLQIFQLNDIAAITEKDDINFYELNDKKMIIYCITSDMDTSMSFLNSIFFSFLFIKAVRQADSNKTQGLNRELCLFLDEFPNIGQIPDFSAKLSTIRSRAISTVIVCQHVAGIKNLYPNDIWQGLVGNTDIKIIMGTNDMLTAGYVSEMLGVATVETNSYRKNAAFDGMLDYGQESSSVIKRNLLNPDEIIRMKNDEQIIILRGHNPFKCKKLKYWDYRLGKDLEKVSIKEYNPKNELKEIPIEENKIEEKLPTFEEFLRGRRDDNL